MTRDRPPSIDAVFAECCDGEHPDRPATRAARWLRVAKLVLTVCLLAVSLWQAVGAL